MVIAITEGIKLFEDLRVVFQCGHNGGVVMVSLCSPMV